MKRLLLGSAGSTALVVGCYAFTPVHDLCLGEECVTEGADVDAAPLCDTTQAPANVSDDYGVFVNGDVEAAADADGSKDKPFKTIGQALGSLGSKSRVFVCASSGAYAEQVNLPANVSLFGGFECGTWVYDCEKPKVAPDHPGVALSVSGSSGATVADVEFVSRDAPSAGDSSIAIFVANSTGIVLQRVTATAGNGQNADVVTYIDDPIYCAGVQGNAAPGGAAGGAEQPCTCKDGTTSVGGAGGAVNAAGEDGKPIIPGGDNDGAGGAAGSMGHYGADANTIASGGNGASTYGELLAASWQPSSGSSGTAGSVGQGGGGGGGGPVLGGGGGGAGGCGGFAGFGGFGGGASIVIAVYKSNVTLSECDLTSGKAGNGGQGTIGHTGQVGGMGGTAAGGATGGQGGSGSGGGGGGGGAGGISVGVLYSSGGSVTLDTATTIKLGTAGTGGAAGLGGAGGNNGTTTASSGSDGQPGVAGFSGPIYPPNP